QRPVRRIRKTSTLATARERRSLYIIGLVYPMSLSNRFACAITDFSSLPKRLQVLGFATFPWAPPPLAYARVAELPSFDPGIIEFLELNSYECHNHVDRKGSLDLTSLPFNPDDSAAMTLWSLVHDRVRDGEMPPKEDSLVEESERADFLARFENSLHAESAKVQAKFGRARSRRLNRIEFENTIHDLLGIDIPIKDNLPEDPSQDGFSNIAEAQQISHHL
ncbi:MAG: DUF1587 domain-containing protein, partial [Opitutales bacterium]|nr:DUF1587 domain-containing protein [Opitutales bacterium]